ncbi:MULTISPECIES: 4Fe-4S dicluster domain-containing protein [unclassified Halanaerobium]|uniref:4Fe-4S dicluster domain-containing protein n=1 Tax=unclassified Halanaerobium TaxID=2641197 RepID=UPI000DF164BD|nr:MULTISPECIES: 4Fe-4S dicluster domain-containing protein [unclassified Halanaerobium]RCW45657.1 Na+-translocating ferredoxin:NAD+ oxidoreductase RnfC subunit [Halanaerobium sp. MA284_MarDTE_T2]RCW88029.1 Na+-translocating ferredoxin:NAD+ oxidoreductase RnfC subunit [Halanaerobium sp. DL-01]
MSLIKKIFEAGVVGAGGAGFPTHVKYDCEAEYLIINGAECEPLLMTDKYLMRTYSAEMISAANKIAEQIGVEKTVFALKKKYENERACLEKIIEDEEYKIDLFLMDSFYPAGDEQIMVYDITGRTVPEGGIPLQVGVVVTNVGTLVNSYFALQGKPVTDKYVSMLGEVNDPKIINVPIGTPINDCIKAAGGASVDDYAVIIGGPMMGTHYVTDEEINSAVIKKTDGALIVLPRNHYVIERNQQSMEHMKNQSKAACIQCRMCTDFCPRYLIGHDMEPHRIMRALAYSEDEEIFKMAQLCCECGVCELYACPMGLSPRLINVYFKEKVKDKYKSKQEEYSAHPMKKYRRIPTDRQISRLNLSKYYHQSLAETEKIEIKEVKIPMSQHIGVPAYPVVEIGQQIKKGDLVGKAKEDSLSANIHASLEGKIIKVDEKEIVISKSSEVEL